MLQGDAVYGQWQDIGDCPEAIMNRLKYYFLTYKQGADSGDGCSTARCNRRGAAAATPCAEVRAVV